MILSPVFPLVEEYKNRPRSASVIVENKWFHFSWHTVQKAYMFSHEIYGIDAVENYFSLFVAQIFEII